MSWQCKQCSSLNSDQARFCRNCGAKRPESQPDAPTSAATRLIGTGLLSPGVTLQGRYTVTREVAKGGQGAVYEANDNHISRRVAIKAVRIESIANPQDYTDAVARIQHEAEMLARLHHPNIVQVLDQFQENGYPYIVMEFVEGETLTKALKSVGGKLPEAQAVFITHQLCSALGYLHSQTPPIIFRDVKPDNVMVNVAQSVVAQNSGVQNVKLIDFGIARRYRQGASMDTQLFGSVGFAAPEQYGTNQSDARSDIYSLGVTLYSMVTGFNPVNELRPMADLPAVRSLNPSVTVELADIIARATRHLPEERWQSTQEMDQALIARPTATTSFRMPVVAPPAAPPVGRGSTVPVDSLKTTPIDSMLTTPVPSMNTTRVAEVDTNRPTTRLLLALRHFSDRQVAVGAAVTVLIVTALTVVLSPLLFSALTDFPFLCLFPTITFAAARRRWATGLIQAIASLFISAAMELGLGGMTYINLLIGRIVLAALVSGVAVELMARYLLRLFPPALLGRRNDWRKEAFWLALMGLLLVPAFYFVAFGTYVTLITFVLAPLLGVAGWFIGDSIKQWGEVRAAFPDSKLRT